MKLWLAMLFSALIWAQTPEIRGVVIEPGVEHGVPDAEIAIFELGGTPSTPFGNQAQTLKRLAGNATTDSQGKFLFQPEQFGDYQVVASKEGYSGKATRDNVTLSADHPSREVRFLLGRTGEITGRVLDEETGEPLVNYRLEADSFVYKNGVPRTAGSGTLANTDDDGRFIVHDLDPGRYVVVTRPRMRGLTRFSDEERETQDYERSYWPGGHGLDSAAPVTLISGGSTDVGTVKLRKTPLYRVQVAISDANCPADERVEILAFTVASPLTAPYASSDGACGEELLLWNFQPGSYGLVLTHGEELDRSMATLTFDIVNKDVNLKASLTRVSNVEGHLAAADGAKKIPFEKLKIMAVPPTGTGTQQLLGPVTVGPDGRFQLMGRSPLEKFLIWLIAPDNADDYAKEIRLNGRVVTGDPIALDGSSGTQSLEIVVDDQPATLSGMVTDGDHSPSKPYVFLAKWPMPAGLAYARPQGADGDDDGQFRFTGLVPGEYRAIAVSPSNRDLLDEPGVLQRLLSDAEKITLNRGGVQAITLKLVDPSR